ncbi:MAG: hypothetical protein FJ104_08430, partial [Deltaproteobacteria bacterium]|nr:hypothetical protein [Deltaproteobacteria bacterium]
RRLLAAGAAGLVPPASRDVIRRHLLGRIEARGAGLRDAFDLLEALG